MRVANEASGPVLKAGMFTLPVWIFGFISGLSGALLDLSHGLSLLIGAPRGKQWRRSFG